MAQENLREIILENAAELFSQQGYAGTSLKQIATQSGCKAPSLYYFFEGGKSEILHEVVNRIFDDVSLEIDEVDADDLCDFLTKFGTYFSSTVPEWLKKTEWLQMEFAKLREEDQRYISSQDSKMYQSLNNQLRKYIQDDKVETVSWLILCAYMGFGHFTYLRNLPVMGGDSEKFSRVLTDILCSWVAS